MSAYHILLNKFQFSTKICGHLNDFMAVVMQQVYKDNTDKRVNLGSLYLFLIYRAINCISNHFHSLSSKKQFLILFMSN